MNDNVDLKYVDEKYIRTGVSDFIKEWVSCVVKDPSRVTIANVPSRGYYKFTDKVLLLEGTYSPSTTEYKIRLRDLTINFAESNYIIMELEKLFKERDRRYRLVMAKRSLRENMKEHDKYLSKLLEGEK